MASLNNNLHAYVKYSATDEIIPGVLNIRTKLPDGKRWVEVPLKLCCPNGVVIGPVDQSPEGLKAFIKYDVRGIVVAGSTIVRRHKPVKVYGTWVQIPYNKCCEQNTTTTTTTTTSSTTTTTTTTP